MFLSLIGSAWAATLVVDPSGGGTYDTLTEAIAASSSGDTIEITSGSLEDCAVVDGITLTIEGAGELNTSVRGSDGCSAAITVQNGADVTVQDLTFDEGGDRSLVVVDSALTVERVTAEDIESELDGSIVHASDWATLTLDDVNIRDLDSDAHSVFVTDNASITVTGSEWFNARGVELDSGSAGRKIVGVFEDSEFRFSGGGIGIGAIKSGTFTELTVTGSAFEGTWLISGDEATAEGCSFTGGLIETSGGATSLTVTDTTLHDTMTYLYAESTTLERVTVTGEAGWLWFYGVDATLSESEITHTPFRATGNATVAIVDTTFSDLRVDPHSYSWGPMELEDNESVSLVDVTFRDTAYDSYGGGLYLETEDMASVELVRVTFENNETTSTGGGAYLSFTGDLTILDSEFADNVATSSGGGLYAYVRSDGKAGGTVVVEGTIFEGNRGRSAGGAHLWAPNVTIVDSAFIQNEATEDGGGGLLTNATALSIQHTAFCGNTADSGDGGGLSGAYGTITNSVFVDNSAEQGAGAYVYDATVRNSVFLGNEAEYGALSTPRDIVFENNIVAWTTQGDGLYTGYEPSGFDYLSIAYNAFYDNTWVHAGGYFDDIKHGVDGNLIADPLFVDYSDDGDCTNDDFRLDPKSTLRDAGNPKVLDPDGSASDIGLFGGPDAIVFDADLDGWDDELDCDDKNPDINPDAVETCDGVDQDCNGTVDDDAIDATEWFPDGDGDGYGTPGETASACSAPSGYAGNDDDCDDKDDTIHPGAKETPDDGVDSNCDGYDGYAGGGDDTGDPGGDDTGDPGGGDDTGEPTDDDTGEPSAEPDDDKGRGSDDKKGCSSIGGGAPAMWAMLLAAAAATRRREET